MTKSGVLTVLGGGSRCPYNILDFELYDKRVGLKNVYVYFFFLCTHDISTEKLVRIVIIYKHIYVFRKKNFRRYCFVRSKQQFCCEFSRSKPKKNRRNRDKSCTFSTDKNRQICSTEVLFSRTRETRDLYTKSLISSNVYVTFDF